MVSVGRETGNALRKLLGFHVSWKSIGHRGLQGAGQAARAAGKARLTSRVTLEADCHHGPHRPPKSTPNDLVEPSSHCFKSALGQIQEARTQAYPRVPPPGPDPMITYSYSSRP
jgi:hypothetical protein